jgi:hypothetical protein
MMLEFLVIYTTIMFLFTGLMLYRINGFHMFMVAEIKRGVEVNVLASWDNLKWYTPWNFNFKDMMMYY